MRSVTVLRTRLPVILGLALLVVILSLLVVAPLITILLQSVADAQGLSVTLTSRHLVAVLTGGVYWSALASTIIAAGGAAILATALGTILAWIFVRTTTFGRKTLEQIAQLPIFIPPFVGAVAWALLFAPRVGAVNRLLQLLGLPIEFDIYTHGGMLWVMGIYLSPYVMMI